MSYGREHFMGANISWAQTFHGREYFRGANIFDVSEYFGVFADISRLCIYLIGSEYFDMCRYFEDVRIHF